MLEKVLPAMARLKVFPLPSAVVLPGGVLPLHIFEPRYRALVADALQSDGVFAMAQPRPAGAGPLPLERIVCVGLITLHEALADGRSNLVLTGVCRARIVDELPQTQPYREVAAEALPDATAAVEHDAKLRGALFELMARLPTDVAQRLASITTGARGGALADAVAGSLLAEPARRFSVLCELDVERRLDDVTSDVLELVSQLVPTKPEGLLN